MMKTTLFLTTLSAAAFVVLAGCNKPEPQAGNPPSGPGRPERPFAREDGGRRGERLKAELGLSDKQAEQLKAIHEEERAKMQALRDETKAKVDGVLTPEQAAKMREFREKPEHGPMPRPEGRIGHRPDPEKVLERMKRELALTEDQAKKIGAVFAKQREAAEALRDSEKPVDRGEMEALRKSTQSQVEAVLTAEQKAKLAQLREHRPGPAHRKSPRP